MGPDSLIAVFQVLLSLAVSTFGVDMANEPPITKTGKWRYRIFFICAALVMCGLTIFSQILSRQRQHEAEERARAMELRTEGENRQLQGQLAAITQFEAQLMSASNASRKEPASVVVTQALRTIRAAEPKLASTTPVNSLQGMNDAQLKNSAIDMAKRMRLFAAKMSAELAVAAPPTGALSEGLLDNYQIGYKQALLGDAIAIRDELWRRLQRVHDADLIPEGNAMSAFSGRLNGEHPIEDGAAYLEKLANQLPA